MFRFFISHRHCPFVLMGLPCHFLLRVVGLTGRDGETHLNPNVLAFAYSIRPAVTGRSGSPLPTTTSFSSHLFTIFFSISSHLTSLFPFPKNEKEQQPLFFSLIRGRFCSFSTPNPTSRVYQVLHFPLLRSLFLFPLFALREFSTEMEALRSFFFFPFLI